MGQCHVWLLIVILPASTSADKKLTHLTASYAMRFTSMTGGIDRRMSSMLQKLCSAERDVYQFGVFTGNGLKKIAHAATKCGQIYGFDSFEGIPPETREEAESWHDGKSYKTHFLEGGYSAAAALKDTSMNNVMTQVAKNVGHKHHVTLIGGYFNETCNVHTMKRYSMKPALYVDMDADIYLSAIQSLDWMLASKLIVPGTILRYDDWPKRNATRGPHAGTNFYGQARAHYELSEKYDVTWSLVAKTSVQAVAIGSSKCEPPNCQLVTSLRAGFNDSVNEWANRHSADLLPLWSPQHTRRGLFSGSPDVR